MILPKKTIGIIGGYGPLASSLFVHNLYKKLSQHVENEQQYIKCIAYYDSDIPDRTESIKNNSLDELRTRVKEIFTFLQQSGCSEIIILCFTYHYIIYKFPDPIFRHTIDLVDAAVNLIWSEKKKVLILSSSGSTQINLLSHHYDFDKISKFIVFPTQEDQQLVHEMLYDLKLNTNCKHIIETIARLMKKYNTPGWVSGCTDLYLIEERFREAYPEIKILSPLDYVIDSIILDL